MISPVGNEEFIIITADNDKTRTMVPRPVLLYVTQLQINNYYKLYGIWSDGLDGWVAAVKRQLHILGDPRKGTLLVFYYSFNSWLHIKNSYFGTNVSRETFFFCKNHKKGQKNPTYIKSFLAMYMYHHLTVPDLTEGIGKRCFNLRL